MKRTTVTDPQDVRTPDEGKCPILFDVGELFRRLKALPDRRHRRGKRYELAVLLLLIVLAKLCEQDLPTAIAAWVKYRRQRLQSALGISLPRAPHQNTYRRVLERSVDVEAFDR